MVPKFSQILSAVLLSLLITTSPVVYAQELNDPIEPVNRAIFHFNNKVFDYVFEPIAKGYDFVTPNPVQKGIGNFFQNLRFPINLVSDILQLKFSQAGTHTTRFLCNTTIGMAGFIDIAKDWGMPDKYEDFGVALGNAGMPAGPYIVIPFLGSSNVRDAIGRVVDTFLHPMSYIGYTDASDALQISLVVGLRGLEIIDETNRVRDNVHLARKSSLDYYLFVQSAYNQRRQYLITGIDSSAEDLEFGDKATSEP